VVGNSSSAFPLLPFAGSCGGVPDGSGAPPQVHTQQLRTLGLPHKPHSVAQIVINIVSVFGCSGLTPPLTPRSISRSYPGHRARGEGCASWHPNRRPCHRLASFHASFPLPSIEIGLRKAGTAQQSRQDHVVGIQLRAVRHIMQPFFFWPCAITPWLLRSDECLGGRLH